MEINEKFPVHAKLTDEKLLPCPFCGSVNLELANTWTAAYWIECQDCSAQVDGQAYPRDSHPEDHIMSAESAVAKWNHRAVLADVGVDTPTPKGMGFSGL